MIKRFKIDLILIFIAFVLIGYEFYLLTAIKSDLSKITNSHEYEHSMEMEQHKQEVDTKLIELKGYLTKMELSNPDYGFTVKYILTLNEPILVQNQTGRGLLYESDIQLIPNEYVDLDEYLDTNVIVAGTMNWGYAHSRILEVQDIMKL